MNPMPKSIMPEFWHHKERIAGGKGQQFIFRNKWFLLMQATCILTLVPLVISAFLFYQSNKTETITDLVLETYVLAKGAATDVEIFFDQYLSTLQVIFSQYEGENLKKRNVLKKILKKIEKTNIRFSSLNVIEKNGSIIARYGKDDYLSGHQIIDPVQITLGQDHFIDRVIAKNGETHFIVSLKILKGTEDVFSLAGIIDTRSINAFLKKLKLKNVVDIYILDKNGILLTSSAYFGKSGSKTSLTQSNISPSSRVIPNPGTTKKNNDFLFSGISQISNTDMRLGILMSNHSFKVFMARIRSHIFIMVSLSVLFVSIAVFMLVTYLVHVLYQADKVRQVYLTKAARSSKMASIGQLAAGVAHEINNPLAIINEQAGLLQDLFTFLEEYKKDTRIISAVDSIINAVERAGIITHRLLGFARETDSCVKAIDVNETIKEILGFVQKEAEYKSIHINVQVCPQLPEIITDQGKLQQIIINLVNNAIAALDEKGTLTIKVFNNIQNEGIDIIVQDNGCGISKEHQKKIFEPFFTTKAKIGGTGLGLALTYGLIRDLRGSLELESRAGAGATFTISLPYEINEEE
ncbi:MAG: hypothetical protein GXP56_04365 [Deltaproteobacteria bacterium]|nr:hypothetical protein [Deltaproteobacteria bacterium]